jgi:glycosyltransferase involved in cell wall biosynthesis
VVVCGWTWPEYRRAAGSLAGRALRVLCLDNQWMGTPHQLLGAAASRHYLRPNYDVVFFPGDSQARFARRMGYGDHRHLYGLYCADYNRFAAVVPPGGRDPLRSFGFVGRLVEDKGVDVLAEAYQRYRRAVTDPWPLLVAGTGPLASVLHDQPGIDVRGFLQPDDLPGFFAEAGAFVLPSRFEPWGVAVHEAAAAGLPIITTPAAGAASRLLLDGYNGLLIPADDVDALAEALERFSGYDDERRRQMSAASSNLAQQFTPRRWATYVAERLRGYGARWGHAPSLGS